jgi:hypothetical protein
MHNLSSFQNFYYKPSQKSKIFGLEAGLPAETPLKFKGLAGKPAAKPQLYLFLKWLLEPGPRRRFEGGLLYLRGIYFWSFALSVNSLLIFSLFTRQLILDGLWLRFLPKVY